MAKISKITLSRHSGAASYINNLNCSLISDVTSSSVLVGGRVTLSFSSQNTYMALDGGSASQISRISDYQNTYAIAIYNDNIFYWQEWDPSSRRGVFLYEKIGNTAYFGGTGNGGNWSSYPPYYNIQQIPLTNVDDTSVPCGHFLRLNFSTEPGKILFTSDALSKSGYKDIEDPNFIACSTVNANKIITFHLNNFYSIGTNTLVLIDPETET